MFIRRFLTRTTAFVALLTLRLAAAESENSGRSIGLDLVADGFNAPAALVSIPDGSGRLLIADQSGTVYLLDSGENKSKSIFLDLQHKLTQVGKGMEERGLLGLALHPDFLENRKLYVVYSAPLRSDAPLQWDHSERLSEFKVSADFKQADPDSERVVLEIDEPDWNHNSGRIAFGPDQFLYWSVGDGGAPNDVGDPRRGRGHPPEGFAQNLDSLLGKILRIDVDRKEPYAIPSDNPFVSGDQGRPEIFAYGLRNPWGMSFDRGGDHDLIVVDVGQDRWEAINIIVRGGNYGWRLREGFDGFDPNAPRRAPSNPVKTAANGDEFVDPVYVYQPLHGRSTVPDAFGVTITGGYVYRGNAFPELVGKYIFADWSRNMGFGNGTVLVATIPNKGSDDKRWTVQPLPLSGHPDGRIKAFIWALGEDEHGELYVMTNGANMIHGKRGKLFKLIPQ